MISAAGIIGGVNVIAWQIMVPDAFGMAEIMAEKSRIEPLLEKAAAARSRLALAKQQCIGNLHEKIFTPAKTIIKTGIVVSKEPKHKG